MGTDLPLLIDPIGASATRGSVVGAAEADVGVAILLASPVARGGADDPSSAAPGCTANDIYLFACSTATHIVALSRWVLQPLRDITL